MVTKKTATDSFKRHEKDTGSSEFQIVGLSDDITKLTVHLEKNKKDHSCRRTLLQKVAQRKSLLNYLKRTDEKMYVKVTDALQLKR